MNSIKFSTLPVIKNHIFTIIFRHRTQGGELSRLLYVKQLKTSWVTNHTGMVTKKYTSSIHSTFNWPLFDGLVYLYGARKNFLFIISQIAWEWCGRTSKIKWENIKIAYLMSWITFPFRTSFYFGEFWSPIILSFLECDNREYSVTDT